MIKAPDAVLYICKVLKQHGRQAWLVGGCVRDSIRGVEPHDWDVTTDATPEVVKKLFDRTYLTGEKHGTITVLEGGEHYEVTTFRSEGAYSDGRHPDKVTFVSSLSEDLSRRDFTVNAIAYDPTSDTFFDPHNGRDDIKAGIVKCVGNPVDRFKEDGLRILRACRFRALLGAQLDPRTEAAIPQCLDTYAKVAKERVHDEWIKIMSIESRPSRAFDVMLSSGILAAEVPSMIPMVGCEQNRYHGFDVWNHTLAVVDYCPPDPILRLGALFHDIGKPPSKGRNQRTGDATFYEHEVIGAEMTRSVLASLKFSNKEIEEIVHLVRHHYVRYEKGDSKVSIRRWVRKVGLENVPRLCKLARADVWGKGPALVKLETDTIDELEAKIATMQIEEKIVTSTSSLAIDGNDVMAILGIKPGPEVGQYLKQLLELVTENPEINNREQLTEALKCQKVEPTSNP